jgi:hypothetical protein
MRLNAASRLYASREQPAASPDTYVNLLTDQHTEETPEIQLLTTDDGSIEPAEEQPLLMDDVSRNMLLDPL